MLEGKQAERESRRGIILYEANPMSGVFRNIDPPHPSRPASAYPQPLVLGGGHTHWVEGGGGLIVPSVDARHCSVLYISKYFVQRAVPCCCFVHFPWLNFAGNWNRNQRRTEQMSLQKRKMWPQQLFLTKNVIISTFSTLP